MEPHIEDTPKAEKRQWVTPDIIIIDQGNILGGPLVTFSEAFLPYVGYNS